jgi:hypothetical protein
MQMTLLCERHSSFHSKCFPYFVTRFVRFSKPWLACTTIKTISTQTSKSGTIWFEGTPKLHFSHELMCHLVVYSCFSWMFSLMNTLSFTCFLDLLISFQLHWVNRAWYKVANNTTTWHTIEIVLVFIMFKWHRCSHS